LERRFSTQNSTERILRRFLNVKVVGNENEYNELLKDATILYERRSIGNEALYKLTINKTPDVLKPILLQLACNAVDWQNFVARAGEVSWIAFSSSCLNKTSSDECSEALKNLNVSSVKFASKRKQKVGNKGTKKCSIHGKCFHSTEECYDVLRIIGKLGYKKSETKNISAASQNDESFNKDENQYSLYKNNNPFYKKISIDNKKHLGLIDTGADVSLMHIRTYPKIIKFIKQTKK
jgi:hypothetical protein